jgi:hypothetical protein
VGCVEPTVSARSGRPDDGLASVARLEQSESRGICLGIIPDRGGPYDAPAGPIRWIDTSFIWPTSGAPGRAPI